MHDSSGRNSKSRCVSWLESQVVLGASIPCEPSMGYVVFGDSFIESEMSEMRDFVLDFG